MSGILLGCGILLVLLNGVAAKHDSSEVQERATWAALLLIGLGILLFFCGV